MPPVKENANEMQEKLKINKLRVFCTIDGNLTLILPTCLTYDEY